MMTPVELEAIAADIRNISHRAGSAILEVYEQDFSVRRKQDDSPLTQADLASNTLICDALAASQMMVLLGCIRCCWKC